MTGRGRGAAALPGMLCAVVIEEGVVAKRVAAVAADLGAELIVVGSEAHGVLHGMIVGDTTHAILRCTPCPVVVVLPLPPRDEPRGSIPGGRGWRRGPAAVLFAALATGFPAVLSATS